MSDFIYSAARMPDKTLLRLLSAFTVRKKAVCMEFHGTWGSLAVMSNHYRGYGAYEDERHVAVMLGGPVLLFPETKGKSPVSAGAELTTRVIRRWVDEGNMRWDSDLAGTFCVFLVEKATGTVRCVTDLISSIPLFRATGKKSGNAVIGSHIEPVALLAGRSGDYDDISIADFIITGTTTYPHTVYEGVTQLPPASVMTCGKNGTFDASAYWMPSEPDSPPGFDECAFSLRESIARAAHRICDNRPNIGLMLSGGEDSRAILASLPDTTTTKAFIFLDRLNREGTTAQRIARLYGVPLTVCLRTLTHFPDIFEESVRLVGSQNECTVSGFGFYEEYGFDGFDLIMDGWWSDSLLKGYWIPVRKHAFRGVPYLPPEKLTSLDGVPVESVYDLPASMQSALIMTRKASKLTADIYDAVMERKRMRLEEVRAIRPRSAGEWLNLWPLTQNHGAYNYTGHRRLFRHYSLFMDPDIIKIGATAPQEYKMNRRLFHAAAKELFRRSRFIPHVNGSFPYYGALTNIPLGLAVNTYRKLLKVVRIDTIKNHGPLTDWPEVIRTGAMKRLIGKAQAGFPCIEGLFDSVSYDTIFNDDSVDWLEKVRIVQSLLLRMRMKEMAAMSGNLTQ